MSPLARGEYVKRMQILYQGVKGRRQKSRLLGQVSDTLDCHRKHAGRLMRSRTLSLERPFRHRGAVYPERLILILEAVWQATQCLWSVRLKAALPLWRSWIKKRWTLSAEEDWMEVDTLSHSGTSATGVRLHAQ
ncbi:MAG: hypothetical protein A3G41_07790 [Elusimicrobia bacterium RIFCSPLOWO2_12_FULL_59_9]|nr:MAG: hypothetical protein A3G41_07790 [Elusimicrobia bacterium RIFCSPLOWO2_12_FULL_59_9]